MTFIAICIFLIMQGCYNEFAPPQNVGWSISYYSTFWAMLLIIVIDRIITDKFSVLRRYYKAFIIPILMQLIANLMCIGKTYEEWFVIMENRYFEVLFLSVTIIISIFTLTKQFKLWVKGSEKIGK